MSSVSTPQFSDTDGGLGLGFGKFDGATVRPTLAIFCVSAVFAMLHVFAATFPAQRSVPYLTIRLSRLHRSRAVSRTGSSDEDSYSRLIDILLLNSRLESNKEEEEKELCSNVSRPTSRTCCLNLCVNTHHFTSYVSVTSIIVCFHLRTVVSLEVDTFFGRGPSMRRPVRRKLAEWKVGWMES